MIQQLKNFFKDNSLDALGFTPDPNVESFSSSRYGSA